MTERTYKYWHQIKNNADGPLLFSGTFPVQASGSAEQSPLSEEETVNDGKVYVNGRISSGGLLRYFQGLSTNGDPVLSANIGGQNGCYLYSDEDLSGAEVEIIVGGVLVF